jgi:hypothetical protein
LDDDVPRTLVSDPFISSGSIFAVVTNLSIKPEVSEYEFAWKTPSTNINRRITFPGRLVFGNFTNPDSRSVQQEALQLNAAVEAAERRAQALERGARRAEYDTTRRKERDATSRQQRKAAEKCNTRKAKAHKK